MGKTGKSSKAMAKKAATARRTAAVRAKLIFPPARCRRFLQAHGIRRVSTGKASVYMAGVLQYVLEEILVASAQVAREMGQSRLTIDIINRALYCDADLAQLTRDIEILGGGVPWAPKWTEKTKAAKEARAVHRAQTAAANAAKTKAAAG